MDRLAEPLAKRRRVRRLVAVEQLEHLGVPVRAFRIRGGRPDADAGGTRGGVEAAREFLRVVQLLDALGHVERDADEGDRHAGVVALDDPARQHVAPAAVGAPVARLRVDRLVGRERLLGRSDDERHVVGVDERAHLVDRQPSGRGVMPSSSNVRSL
jgi:hypothetical protein